MFADFLAKLQPLHADDAEEWAAVLEQYGRQLAGREPVLFWYLSSGIDLRACVHFNGKDVSEVYRTPRIDGFVYSDYGAAIEEFDRYYDELDRGPVVLYKDYGPVRHGPARLLDWCTCQEMERQGSTDYRTYITLEQMIPFRYFSPEELQGFTASPGGQYCDSIVPVGGLRSRLARSRTHFVWCLIRIRSNYFGCQYFPLLFAPLDNWMLKDEVWKKHGVTFNYISGVCDG